MFFSVKEERRTTGHYTTRASRNEVSNVGAFEVGLHSTQVPKSFRKWHIIHILVLSHSPLYMAHMSMSCQYLKIFTYAHASRSLGSI